MVKEGPQGNNRISFAPFIWRFGKDTMDSVRTGKLAFQPHDTTMSAVFDGNRNAIDRSFLDKDGKALIQGAGDIHLVKDDLLIVCYNVKDGPRPERFAGSTKPQGQRSLRYCPSNYFSKKSSLQPQPRRFMAMLSLPRMLL